MTRIRQAYVPLIAALVIAGGFVGTTVLKSDPFRSITIWHGDEQKVGHVGLGQHDFNVLGHLDSWQGLDQVSYRINGDASTPLAFRAYRRLVDDGDFNADVPIGRLKPGKNVIEITASFRNGDTATKEVILNRGEGSRKLPLDIRWADLKNFEEAGQVVDGRWELTPSGLRTKQVGYDRDFLIGELDWQDYEVKTSVTINAVPEETTRISGGNGLGIVLRFAGHVTGGPRHFPSGQPKWGYQPFGAIGWLRWIKGKPAEGPHAQFYPGDSDRATNHQHFPITIGETYGMRFSCGTLPDAADGSGVTRYRYKVWLNSEPEPNDWTWEHVQTSKNAMRKGGFLLLAHHVDATFGDVEVRETPQP